MKRVLYGVAMAGILALPFGSATAEQYSQGSTYTETRGGITSPTAPNATGGAAGYYVRDGVAVEVEGMRYPNGQAPNRLSTNGLPDVDGSPSKSGVAGTTRVDIVRTPKSAVFMGLGGGSVASNGTDPSPTSRADLGASVGLSNNVSLHAVGRYQRQSEFSDKATDNLGANLGLKISF